MQEAQPELLLTQQGFQELLKEINFCLESMDQGQQELMSALIHLSPSFNLKKNIFSLEANFEENWKIWKNFFLEFSASLRQAEQSYQDLSQQMQMVLLGRNTQDPLYQELARQGSLLLKDLQKRQDLARHLMELDQLMSRIVQQEKITPQHKQKMEDLVFRLQLLF